MIHSVIFSGMILNVKGMRYKVIAVRPNGKVTMRPMGAIRPRKILIPKKKVMSDQKEDSKKDEKSS